MAKVVIIGGSGHVGGYLVPRLVMNGHSVVNVTRGQSTPYRQHAAWARVRTVVSDRSAAERDGTFGPMIASLAPDVVVDMICFTLDSAKHLAEALRGRVQHLIHIGTIWVHGASAEVPTRETAPRTPFGDYGIQKAEIEAYLLEEARRSSLPATVFHPGHIVGEGWAPLNPAGHFDPIVFESLAKGEPLSLPNFGLETVHHVHADDVAQMVVCAMDAWGASVGEAFHAVSPAALTLRGYAEAMSAWFGQTPRLSFQPWTAWAASQTDVNAQATWEHIARSPNCSIAKAMSRLGYAPRYTSLQAVQESVQALIAAGKVTA